MNACTALRMRARSASGSGRLSPLEPVHVRAAVPPEKGGVKEPEAGGERSPLQAADPGVPAAGAEREPLDAGPFFQLRPFLGVCLRDSTIPSGKWD